jgi:radical SAM superfamily enzyme YgiQ (UPF0313 family)
MANVLFTHAYFLPLDPKQARTGLPYPPLGTLYAASLLRQQGYQVSVFDVMFSEKAEDIIPALEQHRPDYLVIYADGFNYLTKMCLTNMREATFRMIQLARQRGCRVIVSSSDSTDHAEKYLTEGADFIIVGEAEQTLVELLHVLSQDAGDVSAIAGLAYLVNGQLQRTPPRPVMRELDELPFPDYSLLSLEPYRESWMRHAGYFSINMATTRGCPFKCNWCAKPIYGNRYHSRSAEQVVAEIKQLQQTFPFEHIWFCDDIFGLKPGWVKRFADLVEQEQLKFRFKIQSRADLLLQEDNIRDLARAGCESVWIGAESGSQKILDAMDKGTRIEQIFRATQLLKQHGIRPCFFIQFGYPGETWDDISKTMQMIHTLLPNEIGISVSYPLPGTVFYERVQAELKQKANWTDSDELALMFRNTYPPAFYKQLHRYVHRSYKMHIAKEQVRQLLRQPFSGTVNRWRKALSVVYYLPASYIGRLKLQHLEKTAQ